MGFDDLNSAANNMMFNAFSVLAVFNGIYSINTVFTKEGETLSPSTGEVFIYSAQAVCKTSDIDDPHNGTLEVNGTIYHIIGVQDDGDGLTTLILSRDSDG